MVVPARAQTDLGAVNVTVDTPVTEANAPPIKVANARVTLLGPSVVSALTTRSGIVKYTDVPVGIYRVRVTKGGFRAQTSEEFQINPNREVDVHITLTTSGPRIIGTVVAKPNISITSRDVDADSAIRRISDSLTDALDKLAGVTVTQDSNDPDAAQTISLNNKDESQTSITLDGIPLGPPGSAVNLRALGTDLFTGAGVSFGPTAGGLGGGVNFRTLQPTQTLQETYAASYGSYDRATYSLGETGTIDKVGFAVLHTYRSSNNPLTFQDYLDQSGLTYDHGGESKALGDYVKLRYSLGDARTTINATFLQNNANIASLCTQDVTIVPCGIGPDNSSQTVVHYGTLQVQSLIGEVSNTVSAYAITNKSVSSDNDRYVVGTYDPLSSFTGTGAHGLAFSSTISQGKHTVSLTGSTYASTTQFLPSSPTQFFVESSTGVTSETYGLSDSYKLNDRLSIGGTLSTADVTGAGLSELAGVNATWKPNPFDTFTGGINVGSAQAASALIRTFSDPTSARFDCEAGTTNVSGPGDLPGKQSSDTYSLGWTHQVKNVQFSANFQRQIQSGQLIQAQIQTPASLLPVGYVPELQGLWNNPLICGNEAFNPNQIYVGEPVGDTVRVYNSVNLSARIGLGPNVTVIPNYSSNLAVLEAASPLLSGVNSTTIIGQQLPGRPIHRAGMTVDAFVPSLATEAIANAQYTSGNNNQHLGAYVNASFGITHALGAGKITLFETNAFDTDTAYFSSALYSQPVPTSGGGQELVAANPLAPREYTLSYSIHLGNTQSATRGQAVAAAAEASANRQGRQVEFPPPTGTDPLALATARPSCTTDAQKVAEPQYVAFKAYVARVKAGDAKASPPPGIAATLHGDPKAGDAWYLELRPNIPGLANNRNRTGGFGGFGGGGRNRGGGGFGGPGGGGPGGGGPGGGEGGPPGGGPPPGENGGAPAPGASPGAGCPPQLTPEERTAFQAYRAFLGCAYVTSLPAPEAKAKGIDTARPSFGYSPTIGFFFVRPPQLGTGGGSVKQ